MPLIKYSALASQDMAEIEAYSLHQWGLPQTFHYFKKLQTGINAVASNPFLGKPKPDFGFECRCFLIEKHFALYVPIENGIHIGRILHEKMNIVRQPSGFSEAQQEPFDVLAL